MLRKHVGVFTVQKPNVLNKVISLELIESLYKQHGGVENLGDTSMQRSQKNFDLTDKLKKLCFLACENLDVLCYTLYISSTTPSIDLSADLYALLSR